MTQTGWTSKHNNIEHLMDNIYKLRWQAYSCSAFSQSMYACLNAITEALIITRGQ